MVFLAELIGDKAIYTISAMATRYRYLPIFCGIVVAFMLKMLVAVLLGKTIAQLPAALVSGVSSATFFVMAVVIWFKRPHDRSDESKQSRQWSRTALGAFAAIFFSEWGDTGQITAATLAARYQAPLLVWLAATLALATKGTLAITLGIELQKRVPETALRYGTVCLCIIFGVLSALRVDI